MTATQMIGLNLVTFVGCVFMAAKFVQDEYSGETAEEKAKGFGAGLGVFTLLALVIEWGLWLLL
jgi:hypothetical protein